MEYTLYSGSIVTGVGRAYDHHSTAYSRHKSDSSNTVEVLRGGVNDGEETVVTSITLPSHNTIENTQDLRIDTTTPFLSYNLRRKQGLWTWYDQLRPKCYVSCYDVVKYIVTERYSKPNRVLWQYESGGGNRPYLLAHNRRRTNHAKQPLEYPTKSCLIYSRHSHHSGATLRPCIKKSLLDKVCSLSYWDRWSGNMYEADERFQEFENYDLGEALVYRFVLNKTVSINGIDVSFSFSS